MSVSPCSSELDDARTITDTTRLSKIRAGPDEECLVDASGEVWSLESIVYSVHPVAQRLFSQLEIHSNNSSASEMSGSLALRTHLLK